MSNTYRGFIKKPFEFFTIRVKTDNTGTSGTDQFNFTGAVGNYNVIAINESTNNVQTFGNLSGAATIIFAEGAGTYELKIRPKGTDNNTRFRQIRFNNGGDRLKLLEIKKWGKVRWVSMDNSFNGCSNIDVTADDVPDLSLSTTLSAMFSGCGSLSGVGANWNWNTSNVNNMSSMFNGASIFNQNIGTWNISNVTTMASMFSIATQFNNGGSGSIDDWDVGNVSNMNQMFNADSSFNQYIGSWNTSNVTNMSSMFSSATNFNQDIGAWDTSKVNNMSQMFRFAINFNQNIGSWNTSLVTNMSSMFNGASIFNQYIGDWDVSKVNNMLQMFLNATNFNQDISLWDVSNVINMSSMFRNATSFNQDIGGWDISNITNFTDFMLDKTDANYSAANLDSIYNGWSSLPSVQPNISIHFGDIKYTAAGQAGKDILDGHPNNWTIIDGGT